LSRTKGFIAKLLTWSLLYLKAVFF